MTGSLFAMQKQTTPLQVQESNLRFEVFIMI